MRVPVSAMNVRAMRNVWPLALLILGLQAGGCAVGKYARSPESGKPLTLAEDEVLISGQMICIEDGKRHPCEAFFFDQQAKVAASPSGLPAPYRGLTSDTTEEHARIKSRGSAGIRFLTNDDGAFFNVLPAANYEGKIYPAEFCSGSKNMVVRAPDDPDVTVAALVPGKAYYLGTFEMDLYCHPYEVNRYELNLVEVRNEYTSFRKILIDRFPDISEEQIQIALMERPSYAVGPTLGLAQETVAVIPARFIPQFQFSASLSIYAEGKDAAASRLGGQGAAWGATEGAVAGALAPLNDPIGIVAYPFIAPFTILAGAIIGGTAGGISGSSQGRAHGMSEQEQATFGELTDQALEMLRVHGEIGHRLFQSANAYGYDVVLLEDSGPAVLAEQPDYSDLRAEGFTTALELAVTRIAFTSHENDTLQLALEMQMQTRVVNVIDGSTASTRIFEYNSNPQTMDYWSENPEALIEQEFLDAYDRLVEYVSRAYFPSAAHRH